MFDNVPRHTQANGTLYLCAAFDVPVLRRSVSRACRGAPCGRYAQDDSALFTPRERENVVPEGNPDERARELQAKLPAVPVVSRTHKLEGHLLAHEPKVRVRIESHSTVLWTVVTALRLRTTNLNRSLFLSRGGRPQTLEFFLPMVF
jgi:hypothetical protein